MNYKVVKRSEKRFATVYNSSWKIQQYGDDNLYPQRMADILACSPTGGTCMERYCNFLEGNGLLSDYLSEYVCNSFGDSIDDVVKLITHDVAYYAGFALHVNYNLKGDITEIQHIPFQSCRLAEEDDRGRVPFIKVHPDWEGRKTRNGKAVQVNVKNIRAFYPFNPIKEVVLEQMAADGGIDQYRGQILWVSLAGRNLYPKPVYDKVVTELSVDEGLSNVKYRNVRNNFLVSGMVVHRKGASVGLDDEGKEILKENTGDDFAQGLEEFQGDTNACSLMEVAYTQEEDIPKFISLEGVNFDKKFSTTESSTIERIYAAFGQEPWYTIRIGKTGFTGEILRQTYEYYNSYVDSRRRFISRALQRVFSRWYEPLKEDDFTIQPLVYQYNYANGNLDEIQQNNATTGTFNNGGGTSEEGSTDRKGGQRTA